MNVSYNLINWLSYVLKSQSNYFSHVGTTPKERERERGEGGSGKYIFFGPSLHPLHEQRDRDDLAQMHRLSRAFADHVLPAHTSGSAHVDFMRGLASSAR